MQRILVTGAMGQIGTELTPALRNQYGAENVIAGFYRSKPPNNMANAGPHCFLDVRDAAALSTTVKEQRIDTIFHLASLLSAVAEQKPQLAWDINMNGLLNVLEAARQHHCAVFFPSSIGAFGPLTPAIDTPQDTIQRPTTVYGITKVAGELLCDYYQQRYDVDTRGLRLPGIISYLTPPGGGTTDYAVEIFYAALKNKHYACFLRPDTRLDMMYMPDAIKAMIHLLEATETRLVHRNAYNVTAMNFTPAEVAAEIQKKIPDFRISYNIDPVRQAIADSWPKKLDDSCAREEWDWHPQFDLPTMVKDMLDNVRP
jgi:nucleoside-diphosphate-sugar epimerase